MIVPMHRLDLLCPDGDQDAALSLLGALGVVHLTPVDSAGSATGVEQAAAALARVRASLSRLPAVGENAPTEEAPVDLAGQVAELLTRQDALADRLADLERERDAVAPLGRYDRTCLDAVRAAGVSLTLYRVPRGVRLPDVPGAAWQPLAPTSSNAVETYHVLVEYGDSHTAASDLPLLPVPWPARELGAVEAELAATAAGLETAREELARLARFRPVLERHAAELEDALRWTEARQSMAQLEPAAAGVALAHLRGYVPEDEAAALAEACASRGWAALLAPAERTPMADQTQAPPTLLRYPRWLEPVKSVFEAVGILPGYGEPDVGAPVLVFLSLFFAMLVGDAGYGLLFLAASLLGRWRWPQLPGRAFTLLTIMSTATLAWGALTGTWFGAVRLPALLDGMRLDWLTGDAADHNLMALCFLLGALHLSLAHLWNALRLWPSTTALAQLGWLGIVWSMYYAARMMVLGAVFPGWMGWVAGGSGLLVVLFMTPLAQLKTAWTAHVMLPLNIISNFVDVVSYVRLYAVGAASLAMARAVNDMALADGVNGPLSGLLAAAVLFVGHAGNILLSCMGVLVHGVRLNTLEFANHLGLTWAGKDYQPFRVATRGAAPEHRAPSEAEAPRQAEGAHGWN
ncbi:V-type ATP synthase subunit I [Megalodesulfovibrio paquesii]